MINLSRKNFFIFSGFFLSLFFIFIGFKIVIARNSSTSLNVNNAIPRVINSYLNFQANGSINNALQIVQAPPIYQSINLYLNGLIADNNGAADLQNVSAVFYRAGVSNGKNCLESVGNCYYGTCFLQPVDSIQRKYSCSFPLNCAINGASSTTQWLTNITVSDRDNARADLASGTLIINAPEICNNQDDNCNNQIDEGVLSKFYQDEDNDGFGDLKKAKEACSLPVGYVYNHTDCNDSLLSVNPNSFDFCDENDQVIDRNCNSTDDANLNCREFCNDKDGDGFVLNRADYNDRQKNICVYKKDGECDDNNANINPNAPEICDGLDNNCNNKIDEDLGMDICGTGMCQRSTLNCINGQTQICAPKQPDEIYEKSCFDNLDNDCDEEIDNSDYDCQDADGDGVLNGEDNCPLVSGISNETEYTLQIVNFESTVKSISKPRVFLGNKEIFAAKNKKYEIPIKSSAGYIKDNLNWNNLPIGVWIINRQGDGTVVSGVKGGGMSGKEYIYYKTHGFITRNGNVSNDPENPFEGSGDNKFKKGDENNDELNFNSNNLISADTTVQTNSDFYILDFVNYNGCPFANKVNNILHLVDLKGVGVCGYDYNILSRQAIKNCTQPITDSLAKFFNVEDINFINTYKSIRPDREIFNSIYKNKIGLIGSCQTTNSGACSIEIEKGGKILIITRFYDQDESAYIYHGRFENFIQSYPFEEESDDDYERDSKFGVQFKKKNLRFMKIFQEDGTINFKDAKREIITGSALILDYPEFASKKKEKEIYPFVMSTKDVWQTNLCLQLPIDSIISRSEEAGKNQNVQNCLKMDLKQENKVGVFEVSDKTKNNYPIEFQLATSHYSLEKNTQERKITTGKIQFISQESKSLIERILKNKLNQQLSDIQTKRWDMLIFRLTILIPLLFIWIIIFLIYIVNKKGGWKKVF